MADEEGYQLSEQAVRRTAKAVALILGKNQRQRDDRAPFRDSGPVNWQPFVNDSSETIPANAIVRISGTTFDPLMDATSGGACIAVVYHAVKPDTTLGRYAINSSLQVAAGESGLLRFEGPCEQAFDSGTVTIGSGYGPKPSQWTLSKGYPSTTIADGTTNSETKRLFGSFNQLTTVIGKAGSDISAKSGESPGSGTVNAWYNSAGTFADSTMTFTGYNFSASAITASKYTAFNLVNGIWVAVFESCT